MSQMTTMPDREEQAAMEAQEQEAARQEKLREMEIRNEMLDQIRQSNIERDRHVKQWIRNHAIALGKHREVLAPGYRGNYMVVDRISLGIEAHVAIQTEVEPRPRFVPKKNDENPLWFISATGAQKIQQLGLDQEFDRLTDEQMQGLIPIEEAAAVAMLSMADTQAMDDGQGGQIEQNIPIFTSEDFIVIDDNDMAEWLENEHNSQWDVGGANSVVEANIHAKTIFGHYDTTISWDDEEQRFILQNSDLTDVWIDPLANDHRDAQWMIVGKRMSEKEAIEKFPEYAEDIPKMLQAERSAGANGFGNNLSSFRNVNLWGNDTVSAITRFWRNARFPLSVDEAVAEGVVENIANEETGESMLLYADTQLEAAEGDERWPTKRGIRQTVFLGDIMVYDGETSFSDIPIARNKLNLIAESPYGIGLPHKAAELQGLYNKLWSIYHDYFSFFRAPPVIMSESSYESIKDSIRSAFSMVGRIITVPDALAQTADLTRLIGTVPIPQMGPVVFQMIELIGNELDRVLGMTDVIRGEAKSAWSARLHQQVTSAARGPIGMNSRHTGEYLKYIGHITANLIIDYLDPEEASIRYPKWPPHIFEALKAKIKRVGYDVEVEVGGSNSKEMEAGQIALLFQQAPSYLSMSGTFMKNLMEKHGVKNGEKIHNEVMQSMSQQQQQG